MKYLKIFIKYIFSLLISFITVGLSLFYPTKIASHNQLSAIRFGYPIRYFQQNQGWSGYEGNYPRYFNVSFDFLDHNLEIKFYTYNFVASVLITWMIIIIVWIAIKEVYKSWCL